MDAQIIEERLEPCVLGIEDILLEDAEIVSSGDGYFWAEMIHEATKTDSAIDGLLDLAPVSGAVFAGPMGSGKEFAARILCKKLYGEFTNKNKFQILSVAGEDLSSEKPEDTQQLVEALLNVPEGFFRFIFVQGLPACNQKEAMMEAFSSQVDERAEADKDRIFPSFFIVFLCEERDIPIYLIDAHVLLCRFHLPDEEGRKTFLRQKLKFFDGQTTMHELDFQGDGLDRIAAITENFNYDDLDSLVYLTKLYTRSAIKREKIPGQTVAQTLRSLKLDLARVEKIVHALKKDAAQPASVVTQVVETRYLNAPEHRSNDRKPAIVDEKTRVESMTGYEFGYSLLEDG